MQRLIDRCLFAALLVWLFFASGALLPLLMTAGGELELSDNHRNTIQDITKIFLALSAGLFIFYFKGIFHILARNFIFLIVIVLCWL
ncbi:MAG: hypothetical protein ACR2QH_17450, partial [Geminicoccaceae bacterium]